MTRIGILIGSTRPGRKGDQVARWVHDRAAARGDAAFEVIDLMDHPLPHLDEPLPAMAGQYRNAHTKEWADTVGAFDGFVVVTPEYNSGMPGALKNAIDYLYAEWINKAVGFVSYGVRGGTSAVRQLRGICELLQMGAVAPQVSLSLHTDFEDRTTFRPAELHVGALDALLDAVVARTLVQNDEGRTAMPTQRERDEAAIRAHVDAIVAGLEAKDRDALARLYSPDVISFDIEPPLQHVGIDAKLKNWAGVFTFLEEVTYEVRDLTVTVGGDVAFGHAFARISGTKHDGTRMDGMWVRVTYGFERIDGSWIITHDQVSVPLDVRSGNGVVDLEP